MQEIEGDKLKGLWGSDCLDGKSGDGTLDGGIRIRALWRGHGDNIMDGGVGGHADDVAYGETGDDAFIWVPIGVDNDTFHSGVSFNNLEIAVCHQLAIGPLKRVSVLCVPPVI